MGLFTKKKQWHKVTAHYNVNGNIYRFEMSEWVDSKDKALTKYEFFNKYGVEVCAYDFEEGCFSYWRASYYDSIDDFMHDNGVEKLIEISDEEVNKAIGKKISDFEKIFRAFPIGSDLYTQNYKDDDACFRKTAVVTKKLVLNGDCEDPIDEISDMVLEIEVLDGKSAETKKEFITFYRFINDYHKGCDVEILEVDEWDDVMQFGDYFGGYFGNLDDDDE